MEGSPQVDTRRIEKEEEREGKKQDEEKQEDVTTRTSLFLR